jgi:hypothetical protein
VTIDVPERCAPAMQIAVWVSALFFTQKPYTTMGRAVRQADYSGLSSDRWPQELHSSHW